MSFSSRSPLSQLLLERPAIVELLEASGEHFWDQLDLSVEAFCRRAGLEPDAWLRKAAEMQVPGPDSDWNLEPLYRVVDHLTANHREFRERDLHGINALLDFHDIPIYPDKHLLSLASQGFNAFQEDFREHMHVEESRIFPYILRIEASCSHALNPVIPHVSVAMFLACQGHDSEKTLKEMIGAIREKVHHHRIQDPTSAVTGQLYEALEDFEKRLIRHADIETTVLFPRAMGLEQRLQKQQSTTG